MMERAREHGLLTLLFALSRAGLWAAGLPFSYRFDWLFFADPADLHERLGDTLVHFHLYPPGMNLCAGALFAAGGGQNAARFVYAVMGGVLVNALYYLLRALGIPALAGLLVTLAFASIPSTVYFESSFTDTFPAAALGTLAAALLHRAVVRPSSATWTGFFATLALLSLVRSSFHLAWFVLLLGGAVALVPHEARRLVCKAALGPLLLVALLYAKNLVLFDFFGPGSHAGFAYHALTNRVLSDEKAAFVREQRISRLAALPVYAPPSAFEPYFPPPSWSPSPLLSSFERPTVDEPNFNHVFLLDAARIHRSDARRAVFARPLSYAREALETLGRFFGPSTRYHPRDASPAGPHHGHRQVLGAFENAFDTLVHAFPRGPAGLYLLLPLPLAWAVGRARRLLRERPSERAEAMVLAFCVTQVVYLTAISALSLSTEVARYRYASEPLVWLLVALAVRMVLANRARRRRAEDLAGHLR
ncbi:MAG TPA: hypothetical protein VFZ53_29765 [Polyangiaceae bacterium]